MGFIGIIRAVLIDPPCKECILLREFLEIERTKRDYFEELLLTRAGIIKSDDIQDPVEYPSIHRITTMSSLRRMAQAEMVKMHREEKPEAVKKFEDALEAKK